MFSVIFDSNAMQNKCPVLSHNTIISFDGHTLLPKYEEYSGRCNGVLNLNQSCSINLPHKRASQMYREYYVRRLCVIYPNTQDCVTFKFRLYEICWTCAIIQLYNSKSQLYHTCIKCNGHTPLLITQNSATDV